MALNEKTFSIIIVTFLLLFALFAGIAENAPQTPVQQEISYIEYSELPYLEQPKNVRFDEDYSLLLEYENFSLHFAPNTYGEMMLTEVWITDALSALVACDGFRNDNLGNGQTCILVGVDSKQEFFALWGNLIGW